MGFRACPRLGTRSPSLRLIIRVSVFSFVKTGSVLGVGGVVMVPPLTGSPCKLTDPVPSSLFSFSAGAPVPQLGTSGGPGRLRSAPRPAGRCASSPGSPVTREPATDQNKRGRAAGKARGASAGSLSRSAGNACQPSRVAPAWAWRWVSDSRWCPLHPRARGRGSPNPHSGSRGASAPVRRSRVAQR